jgi:3-oxoacyl-[acyl-carrier protein] reductase
MFADLTGKVAIVTGSGQGIGEGIAKVFASHGAKVVVATRSAGNGQQTVDDIVDAGGQAKLIVCDVGQHSAVSDIVAETLSIYGGIHIAVHNAAIYPLHTVDELSDEILDQTLAVNMKAALWLTQACVPYFREQNWGRLIFTSSVTGPRVAMPGTAHYAMSKGGMNGFIRTAALEYARNNITVNGVEPGYILTAAMSELADEAGLKAMAECIPVGYLGVPEDIAYTMLYLASEEASYLTGQTIVVDGGSTLPESQVVMDGFYDE